MSNELTVFDWAKEVDHQLALIIGGYNSNLEYFEGGEYADEIIDCIVDCYKRCLSWHKQIGYKTSVFITKEGIEEEITQDSHEAVMNAALLYFHNSEDYEECRNLPSESDRDEHLDSLINEIYDSEYCSYSPYYHNSVTDAVLFDLQMAFISDEDSDEEQNIFAIVNDAQNVLFDECFERDELERWQARERLLFVRIPQILQELGSGK